MKTRYKPISRKCQNYTDCKPKPRNDKNPLKKACATDKDIKNGNKAT